MLRAPATSRLRGAASRGRRDSAALRGARGRRGRPRPRRWRERSQPGLAPQGPLHPLPCPASRPGDWKGGCRTPPQFLTQVHKAHDHVRVVEEGAVLRAGQRGRAAAANSRSQKALAVGRVRSSGGRLPGLRRAGSSPGPGLPPLLARRPVLVLVVRQGVVQIQHEEGRGL